MSRKLLLTTAATALLSGTAIADVPKVAVDIAPVHSLVARVMDGVGTPDLIIQPGASPHEYILRPSEAAALQNAFSHCLHSKVCVRGPPAVACAPGT